MPRQARKPCSGCGLAVSRISDQPGGGGTDRRRLLQQPGGRPLGVAPVRAWHVLGRGRLSRAPRAPQVAGHPAATMEHLDGLLGDADLDHLARQAIGHGVEVPLHLDVVVEPGAAATPLGVGVGFGRQRQQGGPLQALEQRLPAGAEMAHRPGIELDHEFADRAVQFGQREQPAMAQPGQDPALHDLHGHLDLGLVAWPAHPRRQHGGAVMRCHVLVGAADAGLIAARVGDAGLEVVADQLPGDAAEGGEGIDVAADPIRQPLAPTGLSVGQVGRPQGGDEDLRRPRLAGGGVDHRHCLPGIVDEQPLASRMSLAHRRRQPPPPFRVKVAEPAVAISVRLLCPVLLPQQEQGDARTAQLGMDAYPRRLWPHHLGGREGRGEQLALERRIVEFGRHRPGDADHGGAAQILGNRVPADPDHRSNLVTAPAADMLEAKNFSDLTHRQSLGWHGALPLSLGREPAVGGRLPANRSAYPGSGVAGLPRNGWLVSVGITGWLASEWPAAFRRNTHRRSDHSGSAACCGRIPAGSRASTWPPFFRLAPIQASHNRFR